MNKIDAARYLLLKDALFIPTKRQFFNWFQRRFAICYAIPTAIIFWNFIEVPGRGNVFKEIWMIHPVEHWIALPISTLLWAAFIAYYIVENRKDKPYIGRRPKHLKPRIRKQLSVVLRAIHPYIAPF